MAHIETYYRCPTCQKLWDKQKDATNCRSSHPVLAEKWAVGKDEKGVRISDDHTPNSKYGVNWALREADLSDDIQERRKQLEREKEV